MNQKDFILLAEKYFKGEMNNSEMEAFEQLRKQNQELDQLVVEQQFFNHQVEAFASRKNFKHQLEIIHNRLEESGEISTTDDLPKPVVSIWKRYKRTIAVAASIAGVTALTISGVFNAIAPNKDASDVQQLSRKLDQLDKQAKVQKQQITQLINSNTKSPEGKPLSAGTSFLIDGAGYLATNNHVVAGANTLIVVNDNKEYIARKIYSDASEDIAILKIDDEEWKPLSNLPYSIRRSKIDLGEEIFTLGYPRNTIVYNKGYLSAGSGYKDDTLSLQIAIDANPGNSGGPLLDKSGNIIGILSTRNKLENDVVYAYKVQSLIKALDKLKEDSSSLKIKLPAANKISAMERVAQIKKVEDCVFMVKAY